MIIKRTGQRLIIIPDLPDVCPECNQLRELSPYGPDNKLICIECMGNYPIEEIIKNMEEILCQ